MQPYGYDIIEFSTVTRFTQTHWRGQLLQDRVVLSPAPSGQPLAVMAPDFAIEPVEAPTPKRFKVRIRMGERQLEGFTTGQSFYNYQQWRAYLGQPQQPGLWVPHM